MVSKSTYHPSIWILGAVAESRSQRRRTAFVIVGVLAVIDSAIYADGPHARRITVTIAVVVFSAITTRPYINVPQAITSLSQKFKVQLSFGGCGRRLV